MAHTDPLTGLANERTVGRILELELARAARQGSEVSLAMFDVDDFQATNLSGGHEAGDAVLRRAAAVLAESVRLVDTVGRIGGDELCWWHRICRDDRRASRARGITALPAIAGRPITVSAGVARFPVDGADAESLIAAASEAWLAPARTAAVVSQRERHRSADPEARVAAPVGRSAATPQPGAAATPSR
jgi:diguanylate cyclase (GGDEF)-like protein